MRSMKFLSALSVAVLGAVACTKTQAPELEGVTVEPSQITVVKGETAELSFAVTPKDASWEGVYWQSSDETVATVDQDGVVTAVATGTAEISVHVDSFNDVCTVTVKGGPLESLVLNETALSLFVGGTSQLSFTYNPEDADFDPSSAKWSSADETVATVDGTGLVTAVGTGETTVTLTAGEITAECSVSVTGEASVGDFFYSDGTWSADLDSDKTCIGVVFYAGHHENDLSDYSSTGIGSVKCHGYVLALNNANEEVCAWGPNADLGNYPLDEDGDGYMLNSGNVKDADYSGFLHTMNMKAAAAGGLSSALEGYPAAWYALGYDVDAPENTSDWFLPSISQLYAALTEIVLEKVEQANGYMPRNQECYASSTEDGSYPESSICYAWYGINMCSWDAKDMSRYYVRSVLAF